MRSARDLLLALCASAATGVSWSDADSADACLQEGLQPVSLLQVGLRTKLQPPMPSSQPEVSTRTTSCPGQLGLLPNSADPAAAGPYPVGASTGSVELPGMRVLTVEAWYPGKVGSERGQSKTGYDIREHIGEALQELVANVSNATFYQACDCYRDLPVANGSFPVLLFLHGTGSIRTSSLHTMTHWASRGFVVFAADHPGLCLDDALAGGLGPNDQQGDARGIIAAMAALTPSSRTFAHLAGHLDMNRVGLSGHSAGGTALETLGDVADVLIIMAGVTSLPFPADRLKSTLYLSAQQDMVVGSLAPSYMECSAVPKRFAEVSALGHMFCTDFCSVAVEIGGLVGLWELVGKTPFVWAARAMTDGCAFLDDAFLEPECGWHFTNYASAAAVEEVLRCDASMAAKLSAMETEMPIPSSCPADMVYDYRERLTP